MGSSQSYLSPEAALTVAVVAGAIGLGYSQMSQVSKQGPNSTSGEDVNTDKTKSKKKKQAKPAKTADPNIPSDTFAAAQVPVTPVVVAFPEVIPGQFDKTPIVAAESPSTRDATSKPKKSKKKKAKASAPDTTAPGASSSVENQSESSSPSPPKLKGKRSPPQITPASSSILARPLQQSTVSIDTDGSWTRVESRRKPSSAIEGPAGPSADPTTSDAGITSSVTGNSSPVAERTDDDDSLFLSHIRNSTEPRRTLAEKLVPKPKKTVVDDMLETPDYPTLARVMRVQPLPNEKPASGFSWGDYEDVRVADGGGNDADGEDDGWGVVKSKRSKIERTASASQNTQTPKQQRAPESLTKKQRQNANKRETQKAEKQAAEAQRLATLAKHTRELERSKMVEQYSKGGVKTTSGGMKASIDEHGKLVWE